MPAYVDPAEAPLFGEARPRDRVANLIVGLLTIILVFVTAFSAVIWRPKNSKFVLGMNIYFVLCILLICCSHMVLIYWYRQGDLEPKFRTIIFYNAFCIIMLCVCANLYIHPVVHFCNGVNMTGPV